MTRVLIAADDTDLSIETARVAHQLFGDAAEYLLINVGMSIDPTVYAWGETYPIAVPLPPAFTADGRPGTADAVAHEAEEHAARVATEAHLHAAALGAAGDPALAIIEAAERHAVDVIAVGSHDRSWFSRLFHPSVAQEIVRESKIPVLVVS